MFFENLHDFKEKFPSKQFICPACEKVTTNPYECNSGHKDKNGKICNWKSYGLFGAAGKGIKILFRDKFFECPKPQEIFMPIELAKEQNKITLGEDKDEKPTN